MTTGFQTAQGSVYSLDEQGRTIRFKVSPGEGQGEFHSPAMCLYVGQQAMLRLELEFLGPMQKINRLQLGSCDTQGRFTQRRTLSEMPAGHSPYIRVQDRVTGDIVTQGPAALAPEPGFYPVEKSRIDGINTTHIGTAITALFQTPDEVQRALAIAQSKGPQRPATALSICFKLFR